VSGPQQSAAAADCLIVMAPVVALAVMLAGIAAAFWPMLVVLHLTWIDKYGAHSHGYLVLALCIWFAVRAWRKQPRPVLRPAWSALPVLFLLLGIAALSEVLFLGPVRTAVLPLLLLASIALCLGGGVALRMAWPILFLYFALPVWVVLNAPLQGLTTAVSQSLVTAIGVPVYVEGNFVHLPEGTFEIASGCSGLNYIVAALTLAAVYCTLFLSTWKSRITLMLMACAAGIAANWLRVSSLIVIGHVSKMQNYLIRVDHLYYGWVLFMLTMIPVMLLARKLEDRDHSKDKGVARQPFLPAWMSRWPGRVAWTAFAFAVAAVLLLAARERSSGSASRMAFEPPAMRTAVAQQSFPSGWKPTFPGAQESRFAWVPGGAIEIYTASYKEQSRASRLSLPDNSIMGHGWQMTDSRYVDAPALGPGASLLEMRGQLGDRERLLWTWYDMAGRVAWSNRTLRAAELLGLLSGRGDARITALTTDCAGDCERARARLKSFLTER
jgi:EpsI family protein